MGTANLRSLTDRRLYKIAHPRIRPSPAMVAFGGAVLLGLFGNVRAPVRMADGNSPFPILLWSGSGAASYRPAFRSHCGATCGALKIFGYSTHSQRTTELFPR